MNLTMERGDALTSQGFYRGDSDYLKAKSLKLCRLSASLDCQLYSQFYNAWTTAVVHARVCVN